MSGFGYRAPVNARPSHDAVALRQSIEAAGLTGLPVCLHASLSSCGWIEGGAATLVQCFLDLDCTLMVPSHSWQYFVVPSHSPWSRNGHIAGHFVETDPAERSEPFQVQSRVIDDDMGAIARFVVEHPNRVRGDHPLSSFSALGRDARQLVQGQSPDHVFAPLKILSDLGGRLALLGVGLGKLTYIHYVEQLAGRRPFVRWAPGQAPGTYLEVDVGGCSEGFSKLDPVVGPYRVGTPFADGQLDVWDPARLTNPLVEHICSQPSSTSCDEPGCLRCNDARKGGPLREDGPVRRLRGN